MVQYDYTDIVTKPNTTQTLLDVALSAMTDKSIEYCHWDEGTALLLIFWTDTLSGPDKTILDGIVVDNS